MIFNISYFFLSWFLNTFITDCNLPLKICRTISINNLAYGKRYLEEADPLVFNMGLAVVREEFGDGFELYRLIAYKDVRYL